MVGSSKILTVSYGTFSCTLEGFDDPFSTMKSIAEYFRDLAADDRYFGAEPPTPDAEMLHRIAEREVHRRVEARVTTGGITLRQIEEAGAAEAAAQPFVQPASEPARDEQPKPASGDAVSEKLSRIRAVVDRARARSMPSPAAADFEPASDEAQEEEFASQAVDEDAPSTTMASAPTAAWEAADDAPAIEADDAPATEAPVEYPATAESGEPVADEAIEDETSFEAPSEDEAEDEFESADRPWADTLDGTEDALDVAEESVWTEQDEGSAVEEEDETQDIVAQTPENAEEDELADRIVRLSQAGHRSGLLSDEDDEDEPEDDATLAGIRMALDAEKQAIAQEKKEQRLERRHVLIGGDPDKGGAFNRILAETDNKLADHEGTRRRSAIAHLKAAVAATKADRMLNRERSRQLDEEEQSVYRDDLAKVVRPRKSEPRESAAEKSRPISEGAEPLILGSSQRVDDAGPAERVPSVQPRRVGAGMLSIEGGAPEEAEADDSAFVAFAEEMGARELPDLLEAAAAYTAFVERQPHFSRPQIMRRAAAIDSDEEFTREAGLRSFGQLLRQGKIRKLQRGQFTISENTRFRPEARIAGE